MDWQKLKSGSDVRGSAIGEGIQLTDEVVSRIADGFAVWLWRRLERRPARIAVGRDSRLSGPRIAAAVAGALAKRGVEVLELGLASTPAMFMVTAEGNPRPEGAIQITASHHPMDKNGLKFFTPEGGLDGGDIAEILSVAERGESLPEAEGGKILPSDYMRVYAAGLAELVRKRAGRERPLTGLKILVDAGNGVGGFYVDEVLKPLGADTSGSQFLEPDGSFPNHVPNPENADAMKSVCAAVAKHRADFGIIFDTDVDRAGAVERGGRELNRNRLIALISAILLGEQPGSTIVTDSVTSDGLADFIRSRGGKHHRYKRGYRNVIDECIRLNKAGVNSPLAIETSGHAALRENYYLDDGAYLVTRILISLANERAAGRELTDLIADLEEPAQALEARLGFRTPDFAAYGRAVIEELKEVAERDGSMKLADSNYEGVRVNTERGWFLVRMSVHDPIMPVNIESGEAGGAVKIARKLYGLLRGYGGLDLSNLEKIISEESTI